MSIPDDAKVALYDLLVSALSGCVDRGQYTVDVVQLHRFLKDESGTISAAWNIAHGAMDNIEDDEDREPVELSTVFTNNDAIRLELAGHLSGLLAGEMTMADFIGWLP